MRTAMNATHCPLIAVLRPATSRSSTSPSPPSHWPHRCGPPCGLAPGVCAITPRARTTGRKEGPSTQTRPGQATVMSKSIESSSPCVRMQRFGYTVTLLQQRARSATSDKEDETMVFAPTPTCQAHWARPLMRTPTSFSGLQP